MMSYIKNVKINIKLGGKFMNNKIEITFLNSIPESINAGFQIIDTLDSSKRPVEIVRNMLSHINKTYQAIIEVSTSDESGKLFVNKDYLPEILWLRSSSAGIGKKALENKKIIHQELVDEMERFYHHFDNFYQTWVAN